MSTSSNEACKLYDSALTQLLAWKDDGQSGGVAGTLNSMLEADPDFIIGQTLKTGVELLGSNINLNSPLYHANTQNLIKNANRVSASLTKREKLHVKAIEQLQNGQLLLAADYLEQILTEYPNDMQALKFLSSIYFYTGESRQLHESVARVLPSWKPSAPHYNHLFGMYAFGLAQDNQLDKAETNALKAIEMYRSDAWATHTMCHVNEYRSSFDTGIKFLINTEADWNHCNMLASHHYWHMALFYLERNEIDKVIEILDTKLMTSLSSLLDVINSSSLLMRLKFNGFENTEFMREHWSSIKANCMNRIDTHGYMYSDSHVAFSFANCGTDEEKSIFMSSFDKCMLTPFDKPNNYETINVDGIVAELNLIKKENTNFIKELNQELKGLFEAIFAYGQDEFDKCVELLYPIRLRVKAIGGSNAQRDVFGLMLIDAAFKSNVQAHNRLGVSLINERLMAKPTSDLTKRLAARFFDK